MVLFNSDSCIQNHTVVIYDRGATVRQGQLVDISSINWTRDRDSISSATVRIEASRCSQQADLLRAIEPKRSEMVVYRGQDRVWEGPVVRIGNHATHVEIFARDIFEYIMGTMLTQPYSNAYPNITEATTRIEEIFDYEMDVWESIDPPANVKPHAVFHHFDNEARTGAVTNAYEMTLGDHIMNFGRQGGLDWMVIGRALHVWDVSRSLGRTRTLTEADFYGEIVVSSYGAELATRTFVTTQDGAYGSYFTDESYYGPWARVQMLESESADPEGPSQAELDSQAQRNAFGRNPVPVIVRIPDNSSVRLSPSLTIEDLVPGVHVPLSATLNSRTLSQTQKIDKVVVSETGAGEEIKLTLVPTTNPDEDVS